MGVIFIIACPLGFNFVYAVNARFLRDILRLRNAGSLDGENCSVSVWISIVFSTCNSYEIFSDIELPHGDAQRAKAVI